MRVTKTFLCASNNIFVNRWNRFSVPILKISSIKVDYKNNKLTKVM